MHELENVYVADGSVFVLSGGFNPTLTIMAPQPAHGPSPGPRLIRHARLATQPGPVERPRHGDRRYDEYHQREHTRPTWRAHCFSYGRHDDQPDFDTPSVPL
jgi:hypothetical protein